MPRGTAIVTMSVIPNSRINFFSSLTHPSTVPPIQVGDLGGRKNLKANQRERRG